MTQKDNIFALPRQKVGDFEFDDQVVQVFPDMIARSVPGYASILSMIEQLAERFVRPGSHIWDLGCSLGAATRLIRRRVSDDCIIHAVDNSEAMIRRLRELLDESSDVGCTVELHQADIREIRLTPTDFVVLNLTLQFVPPADRDQIMTDVADAILPGGALLLSEKLCFSDQAQQDLLTDLHHDFKRAHGYSDLEIAQKRTAIENRLIPETLEAHCDRLRRAGFTTVAPWFQCFNFASILAIK
ncbi:MAG: carboxy-S-adenosyl-L-methionine synthase CmoA [Planctomycetota bacterium]